MEYFDFKMKPQHTSIKEIVSSGNNHTIVDRYNLIRPYVFGKKILDFGCGCGLGCAFMKLYGAEEIYYYDLNKNAMEEVKNNFNYMPKLLPFTEEKLVKTTDYLDIITCFEVLEHTEKEEYIKIVNKFFKMLKVGGRAFITVPSRKMQWHIEDESHKTVLNIDELYNLISKTNFKKIHIYSLVINQIGHVFNTQLLDGDYPNTNNYLIVLIK